MIARSATSSFLPAFSAIRTSSSDTKSNGLSPPAPDDAPCDGGSDGPCDDGVDGGGDALCDDDPWDARYPRDPRNWSMRRVRTSALSPPSAGSRRRAAGKGG